MSRYAMTNYSGTSGNGHTTGKNHFRDEVTSSEDENVHYRKEVQKECPYKIEVISLYCVLYVFGVPFIRGSTVFPRIMGSQRLTADGVSYMCLPIPVSPKNSGISRIILGGSIPCTPTPTH